jgi:hypothetical protein
MCAQLARRSVIIGAVMLGVVAGGAPASAAPYTTTGLTQVTGASPLAGCLGDQPTSGTNFVNSEVEPWVAVDRSDNDNIVAAWQQDRWNNGGSRGLVTAFSRNGGASWTINAATKSSICTGGTATNGGNYERASDPWVDVSPNGVMYLMSLSVDTNPGGFGTYPNAMLVMRSTDGGATWSDPITLKRDENPNILNDKNSLTADPLDSDFVYAVWDRLVSPPGGTPQPNAFENSVAFRGPTWFSRTTNGGASWEPARMIFEPGTLNQTIGNQIVVLPNGDLIDFFDLIHSTQNAPPGSRGLNIAFIRSTDQGETWSRRATIIDRHVAFQGMVVDPDTGQAHRTEDILPEVAVDPTSGNLYAVWQDLRFTGRSAVAFTMSTNGGASWTPTVKINQTPVLGNLNDQAFTPSVHVADDGTVGVTYYDFRNNTAGDGTTTDHWLAHCHTGCSNPANWSENHVAGPFDSRQAPVARGFFLGDYMGLDNIGNSFTPFFIQAIAPADPTSAFYAEVGP